MTNMRCLAVHHLGGAHDYTAVGLSDGLVPKTDPQNRQTTGKMAYGDQRNTRLVGCTRARGNHQVAGRQRFYLLQRDGVVTISADFGTQLAQILNDIEGETIIVVDHQYGHAIRSRCYAACSIYTIPAYRTWWIPISADTKKPPRRRHFPRS